MKTEFQIGGKDKKDKTQIKHEGERVFFFFKSKYLSLKCDYTNPPFFPRSMPSKLAFKNPTFSLPEFVIFFCFDYVERKEEQEGYTN
jgi:hypothetical protein